jgi:hypothetical protein
MRSSLATLRWAGACVVLLLAGTWTGVHTLSATQIQSQQPQQQPTMPQIQPPPSVFNEPENSNDPMQRQRLEKMAKARNNDRQKQLVQDTNKLLSLAKQLKEEVDKSNSDTLSVDVVKKAGEIEKLAKSVKDRMKG